jgi:hypothetical protein
MKKNLGKERKKLKREFKTNHGADEIAPRVSRRPR